MKKFYNGYQIIEVEETLAENVKESYINLLSDQGYFPVNEDKEKPEQSMFVWYEKDYEFDEENKMYNVIWKPYNLEIFINSNKLLSHPEIIKRFEVISEKFNSDQKLKNWLFEKCSYIRDSEMAVYACETLGLSRDEMEATVKDCAI
jgi:hypothetical protein